MPTTRRVELAVVAVLLIIALVGFGGWGAATSQARHDRLALAEAQEYSEHLARELRECETVLDAERRPK